MKKLLTLLFAAVLTTVSARAGDIGKFSGGTGTKSDPFQITKQADLAEIQSYLHSGVTTYEGYYFRIENDIAFTDYTGLGIGMSNHLFQAELDGNGKKLTAIKAVIGNNGTDFGIFSWTGTKCVIKNLTVDASSITANGNSNYCALLVSHNGGLVENCNVTNATLDFSKSSWTNQNGGLVAYNKSTGIIRGCTFAGTVKTGCKFGAITGSNNGGLVDSCVSSADICLVKSNVYAGGIAGLALATTDGPKIQFVNCVFRGKIHILSAAVTGTYAGGISGENNSIGFSGCSNEGTITALNYSGGIAGYIWGKSSITDCRNSGTISDIFMARDSIPASFGLGDFQGGICGYAKEGVIERCFNIGSVRSLKAAGGLCGQAEGITFTDCYNAGLIDAPYCWLSGNAVTQQCGGLVGYKCGPNSYNLTFVRCLSLGTVNSAHAARPADDVYVGRPPFELNPVYTLCHYDSQVAGWGLDGTGALSTAQLTSGQVLDGYSSEVWLFAKGMYPRLKAQATTDAAIAGAAPVYLASGNNHGRITSSFTVGTGIDGLQWSIRGDGGALTNGNVTVTRGEMPGVFTLSSICGAAVRENLMSVYPQIFTGAGSESDPYIISDFEGMKKFARATSEGGLTFEGEYLKLDADIDMASDATFQCMSKTMEAPFMGTFNGNGHSLKNWKLTDNTDKRQYGGLFGYIGAKGSVSNLTIDKTCSVGLYMYGGTIAGRLYGQISDCRVLPAAIASAAAAGNFGGIAGQIETGASVTDCYVGSGLLLSGAANRVGGIAYKNYGTIRGCQYAGTLTATAANHIGGIAAENSGSIEDCLVSGAITAQYSVGGITSNNLTGGSITNSLVTAPIQYTQQVDLAGAVAGENHGTMSGVVYDSQIALLDNMSVSGLTGKATKEIIAGSPMSDRWQANGTTYPQLIKFASEDAALLTSFPVIFPDGDTRITMRQGHPATCHTTAGLTLRLEDADDFTLRTGALSFDGYTSYCYDYLKQTYAGITRQMRIASYGNFLSGSGTEADPYVIATEADLKKLSTESARAANQGDYDGMHFKLTADIDMSAAIPGISCGNTKRFNGIIHGGGHKISGLTITGSAACTGLVGYLGPKGMIENLHIASGTIKGSASYTGALSGLCAGAMRNCSNGATVSGTQTYTGGLIGYAADSPLLSGLSNTGKVTGTQFYTGGVAGAVKGQGDYALMTNRGEVAGTMYTGGVAGHVLVHKISNLENYGAVKPSTTSACNMHGGIIGAAGACDTIASARNHGRLTGATTGVGGIIGRYFPETDKTRHLYVLDCINADSISGKAQNIGGIVGMGEAYTLTIARCANTGVITNLAKTVAGGTPGAGGIMGGGAAHISDCFNAGAVIGANNIGGILGRVPSNTASAKLERCLNTGWLEGYAANAANIGSIAGYYNVESSYSECRYDSCMSDIKAIGKLDREGAEGLNTLRLAPSGSYPVAAEIASDSVIRLYTLPVIFGGDDTRYKVTESFSLRGLEAPAEVRWSVAEPLTISGTTVSIGGDEKLVGDFWLTADFGTFSRKIPFHVEYDPASGIRNMESDAENGVRIIDGAIVVPAGIYAVYTLSGVCVARGGAGSETKLDLPRGVYIALAGNRAVKIVVR